MVCVGGSELLQPWLVLFFERKSSGGMAAVSFGVSLVARTCWVLSEN